MTDKNKTFIRDLTIDDEYEIIESTATVKDAALKMKEAGIPDLVVVDEKNNVLGIIADFDIVTGIVAEGLSSETAKVTEIMYTIEPVSQDTPVEVAFSRMRDLDVSVIPVIENQELVGVATITDCWGMLPDTYEDLKGYISVSNPRLFNYGFTLLMLILYFFFGIIMPLIGITGFIKAPIAGSAVGSPLGTYYLFEARGGGFIYSYLNNQGNYSLIWLGIYIYGFIFIFLGILSAFAIYQWANADYQMVKLTRNWQAIGIVLGVINILIEWILFLFTVLLGAVRVSTNEISLDLNGLLISGLAIIFLIIAVSRDVIFRSSVETSRKED